MLNIIEDEYEETHLMEKEVYEQRLGVRKGGEGAVGRIGNSGGDVCEEP